MYGQMKSEHGGVGFNNISNQAFLQFNALNNPQGFSQMQYNPNHMGFNPNLNHSNATLKSQ
jgi:hypothetical protein